MDDRLLNLLADLRFALGDNGARMQGELVEYAKQIKAKADEADALREALVLTQSRLVPLSSVVVGLHGDGMYFSIGNQYFRLAYAPTEPAEFDFMRCMLLSAFSRLVASAPAPQAHAGPGASGADSGMPGSAAERHLRRLLCLRAGMAFTYWDDGEAQGTEHGISIDFMREPVADIDAKLCALNVAQAARPASPEPDEPEGSVCARCGALTFDPVLPQQAEPVAHNIADEMLKMLEEASLTDPVFADKVIYKIDAALPALRAALAQQAEPLNLADPAVQKRLASQWGYVPAAAQAEPVEDVLLSAAGLALDALEHDRQAAARAGRSISMLSLRAIEELRGVFRDVLARQDEPVESNTLLKTFLADAKEAGVTHLRQAEPVEPVAWNWMLDGQPYGQAYYGRPPDADIVETSRLREDRTVRLLYTAPPQRKPLPKHDQHCVDVPGYGLMAVRLVRAVERAHGIKE